MRALLRQAHARDEAVRAEGRFADLEFRVGFAALTGLRQGELAGLGWDDFEEAPKGGVVMTVRHQAVDGWRESERAVADGW